MGTGERVTLWACFVYVACDALPKVFSLIERLIK
jgi:hypothetical protein